MLTTNRLLIASVMAGLSLFTITALAADQRSPAATEHQADVLKEAEQALDETAENTGKRAAGDAEFTRKDKDIPATKHQREALEERSASRDHH